MVSQEALAIVILNWNGTEDTIDCLASIKASGCISDVFILDNGSEENSVQELAQKLELMFSGITECLLDELHIVCSENRPSITLIRSSVNYGFAGGNNRVVQKLLGYYDYILLLNNDTVVTENAIDSMLHLIDAGEYVAVTCIINYFDDKSVLWNAGGRFTWYGERKYYSQKDIEGRVARGETHYTADFITGCALMVRTDYVQDAGLFTERFFHGEEDYNFCKSVLNNGKKAGVSLVATIYHKVGRSSSRADTSPNNMRSIVIHYLNRIVDNKSFMPRAYWSIWRLLYLHAVGVNLIKLGYSNRQSQWITTKIRHYSKSCEAVDRALYLEIMNLDCSV